MLAKSIPNLFQGLNLAGRAQATRGAVSVLVLMASLTALLLIVQDQYGSRFPSNSYTTDVRSTDDAKSATPESDNSVRAGPSVNGNYRALAEFLAKRYKVSQDVTLDLVSTAHAAGQQIGLDPLLIIAVIAVESRFNPIAESVAGAKGLMQIIPRYHAEKFQEFGGEKAVFNPEINILVGAQILKEYLRRTGNLSMALQMYNGALNDDQDRYTNKVMNEKQRLQRIVSRFAGHAVRAKSASIQKTSLSSPL
jgi:soluble lytic murein transglycosylase-like protein